MSAYLICPICNRKGVYARMLQSGDTHYICRYCYFSIRQENPRPYDTEGLQKLREANPDVRGL